MLRLLLKKIGRNIKFLEVLLLISNVLLVEELYSLRGDPYRSRLTVISKNKHTNASRDPRFCSF